MIKVPEGAQLAIHAKPAQLLAIESSGKVFYKLRDLEVMLWSQGKWVKTSFSHLQSVVDLWDEVHTWL